MEGRISFAVTLGNESWHLKLYDWMQQTAELRCTAVWTNWWRLCKRSLTTQNCVTRTLALSMDLNGYHPCINNVVLLTWVNNARKANIPAYSCQTTHSFLGSLVARWLHMDKHQENTPDFPAIGQPTSSCHLWSENYDSSGFNFINGSNEAWFQWVQTHEWSRFKEITIFAFHVFNVLHVIFLAGKAVSKSVQTLKLCN
jgi:hypothetical protein